MRRKWDMLLWRDQQQSEDIGDNEIQKECYRSGSHDNEMLPFHGVDNREVCRIHSGSQRHLSRGWGNSGPISDRQEIRRVCPAPMFPWTRIAALRGRETQGRPSLG